MDYPGRLIAGIMALILIAVFPLQYIAESNSITIDALVDERTRSFSEEIRSKGYLDVHMYEDYIKFLDSTGELYDVTLEDIHPVTGEEHASVSGLLTSLSYNRIKPADTRLVSKSDSVSEEIRSFASHTHSEACYAGQLHVCNGTNCQYASGTTEIAAITHNAQNTAVKYLYSSIDNGTTWRKIILPANVYGLTYGSNGFLLLDGEANGSNYVKKYDPSTGTLTTLYNYTYLRNLHYAHDKYFVLFDDSNNGYKIGYSSNGTSFTYSNVIDTNTLFTNPPGLRSVVYGNGKYYALTNYYHAGYHENRSELLVSSDCINWTRIFDVNTPYTDLMYANNMLYLLHESGHYKTSTDGGTTWSGPTFVYLDSYSSRRIFYNNGIFVVPGTFLYYSKNMGTSWHQAPYYVGGAGAAMFCDNIFYTGKRETLYKSQDMTNWTQIKPTGVTVNDDYVFLVCNAYGGSGAIDRGPCLKIGKYYDSNGNDVSPICNQVVTSISATNPAQTVIQGGSIITTATATYLDGHTGTVNCTSSFNPNQTGTQTVTLTYTGLVGNAKTTGTRTCTISVTVNPSVILSSLTVIPSATTVYNGVEPTYTVKANYSNGSQKTLTSGYTKEGWSGGPGTKTVTFTYMENGKSVSDYVIITVLPNISYITVTTTSQEVERYRGLPPITVTGYYENGTSKVLENYNVTGYNSSLIGTQTVTITYTENNISLNFTITITVTPVHNICSKCGTRYPLDENDYDSGCPVCKQSLTRIEASPDYIVLERGMPLDIKVKAFYGDIHNEEVEGWISNYDSNSLGLQTVTVEYGGFSAVVTVYVIPCKITCLVCGLSYSETEGSCPFCSEEVIYITADPDIVTVTQYENISLTVTAHYADGSSRIVDEWSIDRTAEVPGSFSATVSCRGANTVITLVVIPLLAIKCPVCEAFYEPAANPRGCPECSIELIGIEAYFHTGSNKVQIGSFPNITLILIYKDAHRELTNEGYEIDNYDPDILGSQIITVRYLGFQTEIEIDVVNELNSVTCPYGHTYYLNGDGSDPGCPYCAPDEGISTVLYYEIISTREILEALYKDGMYYFDKGNYITITVTKQNRSLNYKLKNIFFRTALLGERKSYVHGGGVN